MAVSFEDVAEAAEMIESEGFEVTARRLRAEIGTGSMSTINSHLSQWKERQQKKADSSKLELVSAELSNLIASEMGALMKKTRSEQQERVKELQAELTQTNEHLARQEKKASGFEEANCRLPLSATT